MMDWTDFICKTIYCGVSCALDVHILITKYRALAICGEERMSAFGMTGRTGIANDLWCGWSDFSESCGHDLFQCGDLVIS